MKKYRKILVIVVILVLAAASWLIFFRKKEAEPVLTTERPEYGYIAQSVTATGNVQPTDTVTVGSQVSGIVSSLHTDFNARVKKGQLLAQLDKSLFVATVNQSKATLQSAQSQLVYQQSNYGRQEQLYKVGAISKADYDNATYSINAAKAGVANAQAQLASAEKNLSYTDIYSPMDGVVLSRSISVGQTVAASFNTPTFFTIAKDITKMQVQANVDEADIGNVQPNQRVTFTVDAYLDDIFQGSVDEVRLKPVTNANVVTYTTVINAPNDDQKLKPGMTANVTIFTKEVDHALLISAKALKFTPDASLAKKYTIVADSSHAHKHAKGGQGGGEQDTSKSPGPGKPFGPDSTMKDIKHHKGSAASGTIAGTARDTAMKKIKDSTRIAASDIARVWVLEDSTRLVQRRIKTGINNDTQVEVLEGLSPSDIVVNGMEIPSSNTKASPAAKSPFMPARPTRRGGQGGGGRTR